MSEFEKDQSGDSYLKSLMKQEKLSPEQIEDLVWATAYGKFSNGDKRKELLGDWYEVIQCMVNMRMVNMRTGDVKDGNFVMSEIVVLGSIGEYGVLQQIAEEASELAQAALKYLRFIKGVNPVYINGVRADKNDADVAQHLLDNIREELSDVVLACDVAGFKPSYNMMQEKLSRWRMRLEENSDGEDKEAGHSQAGV